MVKTGKNEDQKLVGKHWVHRFDAVFDTANHNPEDLLQTIKDWGQEHPGQPLGPLRLRSTSQPFLIMSTRVQDDRIFNYLLKECFRYKCRLNLFNIMVRMYCIG